MNRAKEWHFVEWHVSMSQCHSISQLNMQLPIQGVIENKLNN